MAPTTAATCRCSCVPSTPTTLKELSMMRPTIRAALLVAPLLSACGSGNAPDTKTATAEQAAAVVVSSSSGDVGHAVPVAQPNDEGAALTYTAAGTIDTGNAFFKAFGNGRSCASCHTEGNG